MMLKAIEKWCKACLLWSAIIISISTCLDSCRDPAPQPPIGFIIVNTFYKTGAGSDLLNPGTTGSFKEGEIFVSHKIMVKGVSQEIAYNHTGIYVDNVTGFNYIELAIPSNDGKSPLATYVKLSSIVTDTVTYTFTPSKFRYLADKVYYNKQLVWDIAYVKSDAA